MDADHFETLVRSFSTTPSRRGALRLLTSSGLGLLGWSDAPEATAHDLVKKCKKFDNKAKRKKCLKKAKQHNATHTTPAPSSPPGPDLCAGVACDPVRNGTSACRNGVCVVTACDPGFRDCNGLVLDGCEAEISSDVNHCGRCGVVCPGQGTDATVRCLAGQCDVEKVQVFATAGTHTFTVPAQGTVTVEALGAQGGKGGNDLNFCSNGGGPGGRGGKVTATFPVTAGEVLQVNVGGVGGDGGNGTVSTSDGTPGAGGAGGNGGLNGGSDGAAGTFASSGEAGGGGGGGGGASDVRQGGTTALHRIVIAGGGGGGGGGAGGAFDVNQVEGTGGTGGAGGGARGGGDNGDSGSGGGDYESCGFTTAPPGAGGVGGAGHGPAGAVFEAGQGGGSGQVTVSFTAA